MNPRTLKTIAFCQIREERRREAHPLRGSMTVSPRSPGQLPRHHGSPNRFAPSSYRLPSVRSLLPLPNFCARHRHNRFASHLPTRAFRRREKGHIQAIVAVAVVSSVGIAVSGDVRTQTGTPQPLPPRTRGRGSQRARTWRIKTDGTAKGVLVVASRDFSPQSINVFFVLFHRYIKQKKRERKAREDNWYTLRLLSLYFSYYSRIFAYMAEDRSGGSGCPA